MPHFIILLIPYVKLNLSWIKMSLRNMKPLSMVRRNFVKKIRCSILGGTIVYPPFTVEVFH